MDARKLMNEISDVPEIYTLKPYNDNRIAVAVNIIDQDDLLIPVGLATSYSGNITLSLDGMDAYDAKICFIDTETNRTIDLTGLKSYDYVVDYTPKTANSKTVACEDRFFISLSSTITGSPQIMSGKVNVYGENSLIRIISDVSNPIKEVAVYNLQGALLYKATAIHAPTFAIHKNWPAGMYVVRVITENNIDNVKLIIK